LDGHHRKAARRDGRRNDLPKRRQRRGRRLRNDRCRRDDVGHALVGWRTQALIYNPHTGKVIGINALGVAPSGATAEFYKSKGMKYPPEYGPLAAVTPGTPGGILVMLAEYGKLSLKDVLDPSIQMQTATRLRLS